MPEVDRYRATRSGPGTIRDPLDAAKVDDDASDELSEESGGECDAEGDGGQCADKADAPEDLQLNSFETPLGLDPTASPDFVQHVAAFKAQLDAIQAHVQSGRMAANAANANPAAATAQAAAEEECFRAVVDLREAAQKLDKHKFEEKAKLLDCVDNKAVLVPSSGPLCIFNNKTLTECFSEFWCGGCLPNTPKPEPKLTFEELFETLPDREELELEQGLGSPGVVSSLLERESKSVCQRAWSRGGGEA